MGRMTHVKLVNFLCDLGVWLSLESKMLKNMMLLGCEEGVSWARSELADSDGQTAALPSLWHCQGKSLPLT